MLVSECAINIITKHTKTHNMGYWWPGTPLRITLTLQCPIVEGVGYMSAN